MGHSLSGKYQATPQFPANPLPVPPLATYACSLKCIVFNARSLNAKLQEFWFLLLSGEFDVVLVTESWLSESLPDSLVLGGSPYRLARRDRGVLGGGILAAIKSDLPYSVHNVATDCEAMCLDFSSEKTRLILGYIPDSYDEDYVTKMCTYFRSSISSDYSNVITGDFNMSYINWELNTATVKCHQLFFDCISELGLSQLVTEPTRLNNVLDLVMVDCDRLVYGVTVLDHFSTSDHNMVAFNIQSAFKILTSKTSKPRLKLDYMTLRALLREVDWRVALPVTNDVNCMWLNFLDVLNKCVSHSHKSTGPTLNSTKACNMPKHLLKLRKKKLKLWQL
jgi:hypothetical protein